MTLTKNKMTQVWAVTYRLETTALYHNILISRHIMTGRSISGLALKWFTSYLINRVISIMIEKY